MAPLALATQGCPSSPNGFLTPLRSDSGPGASVVTTTSEAITNPQSQATGRHLLEGNLPSGNSRIRYVPNSSMAIGPSHPASEPTAAGKGIEPGVATRIP